MKWVKHQLHADNFKMVMGLLVICETCECNVVSLFLMSNTQNQTSQNIVPLWHQGNWQTTFLFYKTLWPQTDRMRHKNHVLVMLLVNIPSKGDTNLHWKAAFSQVQPCLLSFSSFVECSRLFCFTGWRTTCTDQLTTIIFLNAKSHKSKS